MAEITVLRTFLRGPIGIGNDDTGTTRANTIIDEGVNSLEDLVVLAYDKELKFLYGNVRKLVAPIPDPNWVAPTAATHGSVVIHIVNRPGSQISAIYEQRLTTAAYGTLIYQSIDRLIDAVNLNRAGLRDFNRHKELVKITKNLIVCLNYLRLRLRSNFLIIFLCI